MIVALDATCTSATCTCRNLMSDRMFAGTDGRVAERARTEQSEANRLTNNKFKDYIKVLEVCNEDNAFYGIERFTRRMQR